MRACDNTFAIDGAMESSAAAQGFQRAGSLEDTKDLKTFFCIWGSKNNGRWSTPQQTWIQKKEKDGRVSRTMIIGIHFSKILRNSIRQETDFSYTLTCRTAWRRNRFINHLRTPRSFPAVTYKWYHDMRHTTLCLGTIVH